MRILELLSSGRWSGPAEPMASVARELLRLGHSVELGVETTAGHTLARELREQGFAVRDDLVLGPKAGGWAFLRDLRRLVAISRDFDVLHANFSHDHLLALLALRRRGARRLVRTVHSSRSLEPRALQGYGHRHTDGLVAVCEAHARLIESRFRVPPERILATRGAVDADVFTPDGPDLRAELGIEPGTPVAGIVSRIKAGRRIEELVDAFRAVADRLPDARLVLVGRGEGLEEIRVRVAHRGLQEHVIFAGYRTGAALSAAYRTFDVKVLLAEGNDGTCRALLEGMASGRPGVAYRLGAPAEAVVDGVTGLLVEPGEVGGLADALVELLGAPDRARAMGAEARERMRTLFTERARGEAIAAFLGRVLALPPAGGRA
ncbi:MAG TPA: glycosyltransferase family 4 protein [Anaeromyxobacteraceae bacterium]|nr:glycosyltransferase family 4 protein [Anaeromyxobacteraceae bacterium]